MKRGRHALWVHGIFLHVRSSSAKASSRHTSPSAKTHGALAPQLTDPASEILCYMQHMGKNAAHGTESLVGRTPPFQALWLAPPCQASVLLHMQHLVQSASAHANHPWYLFADKASAWFLASDEQGVNTHRFPFAQFVAACKSAGLLRKLATCWVLLMTLEHMEHSRAKLHEALGRSVRLWTIMPYLRRGRLPRQVCLAARQLRHQTCRGCATWLDPCRLDKTPSISRRAKCTAKTTPTDTSLARLCIMAAGSASACVSTISKT